MKQTTLSFAKKGAKPEETKKSSIKPEKRALEEIAKLPEEIKQDSKRAKPDTEQKPNILSDFPSSSTEPLLEKSNSNEKSATPPLSAPLAPPPKTPNGTNTTKKPRKAKPPPVHKISERLFNPITDAPFSEGENVPFSFIAQSLSEIEKCKGENSKDAIKEIVANVFRSVSLLHPQELASVFYFYIVKLAPEYMHKETGVGQEILVKAIARVVGRSEKEVREDRVALGDLGLVLSESKGSIRTMDSFFVKKKSKEITVFFLAYDV